MPHAPCGMRWIVLPENLEVKKKNGREHLVPKWAGAIPCSVTESRLQGSVNRRSHQLAPSVHVCPLSFREKSDLGSGVEGLCLPEKSIEESVGGKEPLLYGTEGCENPKVFGILKASALEPRSIVMSCAIRAIGRTGAAF